MRVIYADRGVMPMSELKAPRFVVNPVARSAYDPGQIQAVRLRQTTWLKWGLPLDFESERATGTRRHAPVSSL